MAYGIRSISAGDLRASSPDRCLAKLALIPKILQVRFQNPTIGLLYRFWLRRLECLGLDQVYEEPLEHPSGIGSGRIGGPENVKINIKEGIDQRFGKFFTLRNTLINKECIEQTALGKSPRAPILSILFGLEACAEAMEVRPNGARWKSTIVRHSMNHYSRPGWGESRVTVCA